jgi:hypothetical protein
MSLIEGIAILQLMNHNLKVSSESVPQNVRMAHLACIGELRKIHFIFLLTCVRAGSRKVNGVAEVSLHRVSTIRLNM